MNIPRDKLLHFVAGALSGALVLGVVHISGLPTHAWQSLAGAAVAGAGKEAYDWWRNRKSETPRHEMDPLDFLATLAGGVLVAIAFDLTH